MEIRKASPTTPAVGVSAAKVSKGTKRFGEKLESKIKKFASNIHKTFRNPDHQKFVNAPGGIQEESAEVAAIRESLSKSK